MSKTRRQELGQKLRRILGSDNVYFQPPNNTKIQYPCIIYSKEQPSQKHADDQCYYSMDKYEILVVDRDPDSDIPDKINDGFEHCQISRYFVKDNLNQTILTLYY